MRQSYLREFIPAIACFDILQAIVEATVDANTSGVRLWVLLPVLPLIGVAVPSTMPQVWTEVPRQGQLSRRLCPSSRA